MAAIQSGRRLRDLSGRVVMNGDPEAAEPADAGTIQTVHPDGIPIRLDPVTNYHSIHSAPVANSRLRPDDGSRCQPTGSPWPSQAFIEDTNSDETRKSGAVRV